MHTDSIPSTHTHAHVHAALSFLPNYGVSVCGVHALTMHAIVYQALNPRPPPLFSATKVGTPYESLGMIEAKALLDTRV